MRSNSDSFLRLVESSWMPNLMFLANCSENLALRSLSWTMSSNISKHFFTKFLRMTLRILFCCNISLEMLRGRSSESTTPLMKPRYSGISSSQLSLHGEVFAGEMVFPVVGETLVEVSIFLLRNVVGVTSPDWLRLVQFFIFVELLLDLFGLLNFGFGLFLILLDLLDFGLVWVFGRLFLLFTSLLLHHLLDLLLRHHQIDGVADELRVLLHHLLDLLLFQELGLVILHMQNDSSASVELWDGIGIEGFDGEGSSGGGLPFVVVVVIVLGLHRHAIRHQVGRVKTHAELTNHRNVSAGRQRLHESLSSRFGNGTQVIDQISFGHADSGVPKRQRLVFGVRDDANVKVLARVQLARLGKRFISDLV